jgi:hypothetical protein
MKYFPMAVLLIITIIPGCKGDNGPVGPAGNANVTTFTFTFKTDSLHYAMVDTALTNSSTQEYTYGTIISLPAFISASSDGGEILVYMRSVSPVTPWFQLPFSDPEIPLTITYSFSDSSFFIDVFKPTLNTSQLSSILASSYYVRIVMIPPTNRGISSSLAGKHSYDEVKAILRLPD